jgi:hypothetical protein
MHSEGAREAGLALGRLHVATIADPMGRGLDPALV